MIVRWSLSSPWRGEQTFAIVRHLGDLNTPEDVERERRSVAMLSPGAPVYDREEALAILKALGESLARHPSGRSQAAGGRETPANGGNG